MSACRSGAWLRDVAALLLGSSALACSGTSSSRDAGAEPGAEAGAERAPLMSREDLMNPEKCEPCHPKHYREWKSSMHAYAARDPVFIAMNKRGQRETHDEMGDFCVRCHAPMAVYEGATTNGLNLDQVPKELQGVTCYVCHAAAGHEALFNNGLVLEEDGVMRGPYRSAIDPGVHGVSYSSHHDSTHADSAALCGSCHDVVTPAGVHMERTYAEYAESLFAIKGPGFSSCQTCHMEAAPEDQVIAQMAGVTLPKRKRHSHLWPAVDVALTDDVPDQDVQRKAVQCELYSSLSAKLRAIDRSGYKFVFTLETDAGHSQPSGAAQDRRMWIEATGYDSAGNVVSKSGAIGPDEIEDKPVGSPGYDASLFILRDRLFDAQGHEAHMFWQATRYEKLSLGVTGKPDHSRDAVFTNPVPVERFEVSVYMRPIGMDVLRSLVESGDLDDSVLARMPTFLVATAIWNRDDPDLGPLDVRVLERPEVPCTAGGF